MNTLSRTLLVGSVLLGSLPACADKVTLETAGSPDTDSGAPDSAPPRDDAANACPAVMPAGACTDTTHTNPSDTCFYTLPCGAECDVYCQSGTWVPSCTTCPDDSGVPGSAVGTSPDSGACYLRASDYDQSCTQDSDCVLVPPGGNICEPTQAGTGCLFCELASVNVSVGARYAAALQAAIQPFQGQGEYGGYAFGGCPTEPQATCQGGKCGTSAGPICGAAY